MAHKPETIEALLELRFQVANLFQPGIWTLSPGGDLYTYHGSTGLLDQLREAYDQAHMRLIEEDEEDDD